MSSPTELLPGTGIAATSWKDASYHLRVYTQDIQGGIRESRWDGNWSGGTANDVIARAKPHSPIAVFNYNAGKSVCVVASLIVPTDDLCSSRSVSITFR